MRFAILKQEWYSTGNTLLLIMVWVTLPCTLRLRLRAYGKKMKSLSKNLTNPRTSSMMDLLVLPSAWYPFPGPTKEMYVPTNRPHLGCFFPSFFSPEIIRELLDSFVYIESVTKQTTLKIIKSSPFHFALRLFTNLPVSHLLA